MSKSSYGSYNTTDWHSVNVIDPTFGHFVRNFIIDDYYLTVFGTKISDQQYQVVFTKKYVGGKYQTSSISTMNVYQINQTLNQLEQLDSQTFDTKWRVINSPKSPISGTRTPTQYSRTPYTNASYQWHLSSEVTKDKLYKIHH